MSALENLRAGFRHSDWANGRLLDRAAELSDDSLDNAVEMGHGSLRATLHHIWAAEQGWLRRWQRPDVRPEMPTPAGERVGELRARLAAVAAERDAFLCELGDAGLGHTITYTNTLGQTATFSHRDMTLHVYNHGIHHRAQAAALLRQLGRPLPPPGLDYLFYVGRQPPAGPDQPAGSDQPASSEPPAAAASGSSGASPASGGAPASAMAPPAPPLYDLSLLKAYLRYGDWAQDRVLALAGEVDEAALGRAFPFGRGSVRATLLHIRNAEAWWVENWHGRTGAFPDDSSVVPLAEIVQWTRAARQARDAFVATRRAPDLSRPVQALAGGRVRTFTLGAALFQLGGHGTHHRAQALNMLRRLGAATPNIDLVAMLRECGLTSAARD